MYFDSITKAVDTAETMFSKTLTYVPAASRDAVAKVQEAYFSAARANSAAFATAVEKFQSLFTSKK